MIYLVAISVRGAVAFDIGERIDCPACSGEACEACDGEGFWWINPVYGHRQKPWRWWALSELEGDVGQGYFEAIRSEMPSDWPDHFRWSSDRVTDEGDSLTERLGLAKPKVLGIMRRL